MVTIMKKLINKLAGFIFNLIGLPYYVAKEIIKWTVVGINKLIDVIAVSNEETTYLKGVLLDENLL